MISSGIHLVRGFKDLMVCSKHPGAGLRLFSLTRAVLAWGPVGKCPRQAGAAPRPSSPAPHGDPGAQRPHLGMATDGLTWAFLMVGWTLGKVHAN